MKEKESERISPAGGAHLLSFFLSFFSGSLFIFLSFHLCVRYLSFFIGEHIKDEKENEDQHSRDQAYYLLAFVSFNIMCQQMLDHFHQVSNFSWILPIARLLFLSSVPGGKIPRVETNERECWEFLDWRLASENDSLVSGQPSFLKELLFQRLTGSYEMESFCL